MCPLREREGEGGGEGEIHCIKPGPFSQVVEAADVVLEVLDARDPAGSRVQQLEAAIHSQPGKKLVLVLNKADLVPRANLEAWLKHLRREHPAIAFKSSTQTQSSRLAQTTTK